MVGCDRANRTHSVAFIHDPPTRPQRTGSPASGRLRLAVWCGSWWGGRRV